MVRITKSTLPAQNAEHDTMPTISIPLPEVALLVFSRLLQGDSDLLNTLGLTEADLYRLRRLPSESLPRLMTQAARGEIIEVRFHRQALRRFLQYLNTDGRSENEIRTMIEADASQPFMWHFYGMSYTAYHQYRQKAGLVRSRGRPSTPDETVTTEIASLLQKLDLLSRPSAVGPFDLLAIHQLTGYSLRDVWSVYADLA